jgi:hypothetical protein
MGFRCRPIDSDTLRVWSPFTYGGDGERIGLYVEKSPNGYRITDACESLMHASSMGIPLTVNKLNAVRRSIGLTASISEGGEISAFVSEEDIGRGVASVLNASLAVSHLEGHWAPRAKPDSFVKNVATVLEASLGDKVLRNVSVVGASGHQLELPIAVKLAASLVYVQPIASTEENKIDWKNVYAGYGRMIDLKNASVEGTSRLIVLEDAANDPETAKAVRLLAETSPVVQYSKLRAWAAQKAA